MNNYLLTVNDFTDPQALERRLEVRPAHFTNARKLVDQGVLISGGALLDDDATANAGKGQFQGSFLILSADSPADVMKIIENDVYVTNKVWDLSTVKITKVLAAKF
ncbi:Protein YciI [Smittium mucronatum]|uniref:Protein YciI n=1 Tax=Smittium mucronatum TaxID=133383 RepID=A0A1R0H0M7_9FUNG|nr:Protein YciI [Smittium mucronatum]